MTTDQRRRELLVERDAEVAALEQVIEQLKGQIAFVERERDDLLLWQEGARKGAEIANALKPTPDGQFYLGDKVRVVLEGVLASYDAELGHYTIRGNTTGAQHVEWIHNLHWGTEFEVIEPGPRNGAQCSSCGGLMTSPPCQRNPLTGKGGHTVAAGTFKGVDR